MHILVLVLALAVLFGGVRTQEPPPAADSQSLAAGEYGEFDLAAATDTNSLVNYTQSLLGQNLTVLGQAVRIPNSVFRSHRCQVVYLGNPDWSSLELDVRFVDPTDPGAAASAAAACSPGAQPQAFYAYVDGYRVPRGLNGATLSFSSAPWAAVVLRAPGSSSGSGSGTSGDRSAEPPPTSLPPPPPPPQEAAGVMGNLRRRLLQLDIGNIKLSAGRESFQSAYDNVRDQAKATQELLQRGNDFTAGPDGPLAVPVLASRRRGASVATESSYSSGAMADLERVLVKGSDAARRLSVLSDSMDVYRAPEEDCLQLMAAGGRPGSGKGSTASSRASVWRSSGSTVSQDSCFVTQLAVYIYNPCAPAKNSSSDSSGDSGSSNSSVSGGAQSSTSGTQLIDWLDKSLAATAPTVNETLGYVQLSVRYWTYDRCLRRGADTLADVSLQVMVFAALAFGWLLLFLLLPSLYRLLLEFPFRLLMHGIRKLSGKDDKLKPLKPGLHSRKAHRGITLWAPLAAVVDPLLRLRKMLLYAVATVHYSDGQSRWLQVSVISSVALSIGMAVYAPSLSPPLHHFVPPLALQITRTDSAVAALQYFMDIVIFSSFMGTLGYLSMLANYNSPINQYYRVQCIISAFFMLLADTLVLLQLISLLAQWDNLRPAWPYMPLVTFQMINLAAANVLQVIIFSKRHDQHNRSIYAAYVEARQDRFRAEADVRAEARAVAKAARLGLLTSAGKVARSGSRRLGVLSGGSGSSGSSTADEQQVWLAGMGCGGGEGGSLRPSGDGGDGMVNFRRHRQRVSKPQHEDLSDPQEVDGEEDEGADGGVEAVRPAAVVGTAPHSSGRASLPSSRPSRPSRRKAAASTADELGEDGEDAGVVAGHGTGRDAGSRGDSGYGAADTSYHPRRRLMGGGPGPVAEGRERPSGGGGSSSSSPEDGYGSGLALLPKRSSRPSRSAANGAGAGPRGASTAAAVAVSLDRKRSGGRRQLLDRKLSGSDADSDATAAADIRRSGSSGSWDAAARDTAGRRLFNAGDGDVVVAGGDTDGAGGTGICVSQDGEDVPYYKRAYKGQRAPSGTVVAGGLGTLSSSKVNGGVKGGGPKAHSKAADKQALRRGGTAMSGGSSVAAAKEALRGMGSDSDGGDGSHGGSSEGPGGIKGVLMWPAHATLRVWHGLRESRNFRYPAWLLAALMVSGYMVIFQYARALEWSDSLGSCFVDPGACVTGGLGRYVRFASRVFSRSQQTQLKESLDGLMGTRGDMEVLLSSAIAGNYSLGGGNSSSSNTTGGLADMLTQLAANLTGSATGTLSDSIDFDSVVSGALNQSLVETGLATDPAANSSGLMTTLSPALSAALQSRLVAAMEAQLRQLTGQLNLTSDLAATSSRQATLRADALAALNTTLDSFYNTVNVTSRFMGRALEVEGEVRAWQTGLHARFVWSSVLGFTLGLFLGLSTLIQTAISFRRAVRNARTIRVMKKLFGRSGVSAEAGVGPGGGAAVSVEDSLLANRAMKTSVSLVVFFFGVLMSTAVIQLYMVGVLLSVLLAIVTHPWTWTYLLPSYWLYLAAIAAVFVLNKYVLIGYVGDAFLSNGDHIYRPAAWLAFTFIMSITNLVIGLLLAVYRIVLLLLTTVLSLGKLEVTIFTFFSNLDLPHQSFLAGLHMHEAMSSFHDPIYLPGPRGRAYRRWRKLRDTVRRLKPEELRLLATLGRSREVQNLVDGVMSDMQAAKALATASTRPAAEGREGSNLDRFSAARPPALATGSRPLTGAAAPLAAGSRPLATGSRPLGTTSKPLATAGVSRFAPTGPGLVATANGGSAQEHEDSRAAAHGGGPGLGLARKRSSGRRQNGAPEAARLDPLMYSNAAYGEARAGGKGRRAERQASNDDDDDGEDSDAEGVARRQAQANDEAGSSGRELDDEHRNRRESTSDRYVAAAEQQRRHRRRDTHGTGAPSPTVADQEPVRSPPQRRPGRAAPAELVVSPTTQGSAARGGRDGAAAVAAVQSRAPTGGRRGRLYDDDSDA